MRPKILHPCCHLELQSRRVSCLCCREGSWSRVPAELQALTPPFRRSLTASSRITIFQVTPLADEAEKCLPRGILVPSPRKQRPGAP